jgi:hypothetical protein
MNNQFPEQTTGFPPESNETIESPEQVVEQPAHQPEPELYEVKVAGQTIKVPLDELRNGYSRQQDYTRKTTELSEWRRQAEERVNQYATALQQYEALVSDPRVRNYLESLNAGNESLEDVPTVANVQKLLESRTAQIEQTISQRIAAAQAEMEIKQLQSTYEEQLSSTFRGVTEKFPFLGEIPGIEMQLRKAVAERGPQNIEDAKRLLLEEATTRAQKVVSHFQSQQKQDAISRAKQLKGIEPPGGQAPPPLESAFKLGSKDLREQAIADLVAGFNNRE